MIKIKLLDGPYAGQTRTGDEVATTVAQGDFVGFLMSLARQGWHWEITWSREQGPDDFAWAQADLIARTMWAIIQGRPVHFLGFEFKGSNVQEVAG